MNPNKKYGGVKSKIQQNMQSQKKGKRTQEKEGYYPAWQQRKVDRSPERENQIREQGKIVS